MAVELRVILEGDGAFADVPADQTRYGEVERVVALDGGMSSGLPSVAVGIRLADGTVAIGQTSARALVMAAQAIRARFPAIDADG